jgi:formylglycine-generating enzyme required for sulfatase activity
MNWPETGPRVLVFGNRTFTCSATIHAWLLPLQAQWIRVGARDDNAPTVIHGAADGADMIAHQVALDLGFKVRPFPVPQHEWRTLGARAGYLRDRRMAEEGKPHFGLGFGKVQKDPRKVDRSGSGHMLDILNELGIRVTMVAQPGDYPGVLR